jgi:hypothetical protein
MERNENINARDSLWRAAAHTPAEASGDDRLVKTECRLLPTCRHTWRCYRSSMLWKTVFATCYGISLASEGLAQTHWSQSAFNSFLTNRGGARDRVTLVGKPRSSQLDTLLPANAMKMFRVVLSCSVANSGKLFACRKDPAFPEQFGDMAVARKALDGVSVARLDIAKFRRKNAKLQVVIDLDDPTRPLDRYNFWSVPTPEPVAPPSP